MWWNHVISFWLTIMLITRYFSFFHFIFQFFLLMLFLALVRLIFCYSAQILLKIASFALFCLQNALPELAHSGENSAGRIYASPVQVGAKRQSRNKLLITMPLAAHSQSRDACCVFPLATQASIQEEMRRRTYLSLVIYGINRRGKNFFRCFGHFPFQMSHKPSNERFFFFLITSKGDWNIGHGCYCLL